MSYDGFISYSHAADGLLAPRLQAGLQRFAKPWWKRRALRMFRDESSLSANPHLWSSIVDALNDSEWFVLLLSPEAASSEWVNQEIEHWTEYRDPTRILPVVTDGEFGWNNGNVTGTAVPAALHGVFAEEPRWVDLRFAKDEDQLDLKNPQFSNAVADIASAIRGIPKDELASEEVKQHRRTIRTAWAAASLVGFLAVAATIFAIQSAENATRAEEQAAIAQGNADEAREQSERAEGEADRANNEAARANHNAQLARARELAASAIGVLDLDPELATLLAIAAIDESPNQGDLPIQLESALWRAGSTNRLVDEIVFDHESLLSLSADGSTLAATTAPNAITGFDTSSGNELWLYSEETVDFFTTSSWSPEGLVAVTVIDSSASTRPAGDFSDDGLPSRVLIIDGASGELLETLEYLECSSPELPAWSPDGRYLAISNGPDACRRATTDGETDNWVEVFETSTWTPIALLPIPEQGDGPRPLFDAEGNLHATLPGGEISRFSASSFVPMDPISVSGMGDVTSDGSRYVLSGFEEPEDATPVIGSPFSAWVVDALSGSAIDTIHSGVSHVSLPLGIEITRDDRYVVVGVESSTTSVYELATGVELFRLPTGPLNTSAFDPARELLYTSSSQPGILIWDLAETAVGVDSTGDIEPFNWVNGTGFYFGTDVGGMDTADFATGAWAAQFFDITTGALVGEPWPDLAGARPLADGGWLVSNSAGEAFIGDPITGETVRIEPCDEEFLNEDGEFDCGGANDPDWYFIQASEDGEELVAIGSADGSLSGHVRLIDPETGTPTRTFLPGEPNGVYPAGTEQPILNLADEWLYARGPNGWGIYSREDGALLFPALRGAERLEWTDAGLMLMKAGPDITVIDMDTWQEVLTSTLPTRVRGAAFNNDGSRIALGTIDSLIVIDSRSGLIVKQVRIPWVSDSHWIDDETLLVGTGRGVFGTISLSTDEFLTQVRTSLRRGFTPAECQLYQLDPCPDLEQLQGG